MNDLIKIGFAALLAFSLVSCSSILSATATPTPTSTPSPEPTLRSGIISGIAYANESSVQRLVLHLPAGREPSAPVIFFPYGTFFTSFVRFFTELGYPVVTPMVRNDTFQVETQDSFCALAYIHSEAETYGLDPTRIIAVGGSMGGGTAALLAALDDPTEFLVGCEYSLPETGRIAAVVSLAGVFDYSVEEDFFEGFIENITGFMEGTPEENPQIWEQASAINHINGNEPVFLLLHGMSDVNVSPHQSIIFAEVLEQAGVVVELVLLPGLDHGGIMRNETTYIEIEIFLEEYFQ